MTDVILQLRAEGYPLDEFTPDGKIHRFKLEQADKKKSGYYVGFRNFSPTTQEEFYVVAYGSWREEGAKIWCSLARKTSAEESQLIKKNMKKAQEAAEKERLFAQDAVAIDCLEKWQSLSDSGPSEYLKKKRLSDCPNLGIKYDKFSGEIFVPVKDINGKLWSLQKIRYDGTKQFHPGGKIARGFHCIGPLDEKRIFISEGLATAASIHLATGFGVICAFTGVNLTNVATDLRGKYPDAEIIICGDDDRNKESNPGRVAAEAASKKCLGATVFPVFKNPESRGKDFNDVHVEDGIEAVCEIFDAIAAAPPKAKLALYALGFKENEYFFTSTSNRQVVGITSFSEDAFLKLLPMEYWEAMYPGKGDSGIAWMRAKSDLMSQCRARGIFQSYNVRGSGVWMDDGRIVVNMGDHLIVDGDRVELGSLKSRYFYTLGKSLQDLREDPLTVKECDVLREACTKFNWRKDESGLLLAGALVTSRVCGALPVRPHCWITGGAETGKTTLLEKLVRPILGESKLYVQGNTTEAGVRQSLKADAVPVLFDEFETNGPRSKENIDSLIELMRASWAESSAVIVKGGSSGNASHFQVRFSAIVSSIRTRLTNDADKGRFAVVELAPHGSDPEHWKELSGLLAQIDEEYAERLFARTIKMLPVMIKNYRVIKAALAQKVGSRFGDQYGMILAGFSILTQDEPLDKTDAEFLADNLGFQEERESAKQADHDDAIDHLLTTKIHFESDGMRKEALVSELIAKVLKSPTHSDSPMGQNGFVAERNALLRLGIRVDSDTIAIAANNHAELESQVWKNTKWSQSWGVSIARLDGAARKNVRMDRVRKCVVLPHKILGLS